jgi:hypothetical protein
MAMACSKVCGRNKLFQSLFGSCFVIDYQLKTISFEEESFSMTTLFALVGAVQVKLRITFSSGVIILAWCGIVFTSG